jgi:hypothetical protein
LHQYKVDAMTDSYICDLLCKYHDAQVGGETVSK